jgi:hypothetical protein
MYVAIVSVACAGPPWVMIHTMSKMRSGPMVVNSTTV